MNELPVIAEILGLENSIMKPKMELGREEGVKRTKNSYKVLKSQMQKFFTSMQSDFGDINNWRMQKNGA